MFEVLKGSLGASGAFWGVLGAPELALGGFRGVPKNRALHLEAPRLQGGVWEPIFTIPSRVHMRLFDTCTWVFDDFQKLRVFANHDKKHGVHSFVGGCFSRLVGPWGPPGE